MIQGWTLKKEVSIGDAVAFATALVAVLYSYSTLDKRLTVLEQIETQQRVIDARQDSDTALAKQELRQDLGEINRKLDRLIERGK